MKTLLLRTAIVSALASQSMYAWSQQAQPQTDAEEATEQQEGIEQITVTAQRVASSIQKTPISMQAYGSEELRKRGISDIQSLARSDSSVNINLSTGQPIIAIRGVASQDATEVGDPAVSIATDGVFTNRPSGTLGGLYDIERVEILRGPQGTLFGRNSTGGTLNIITARPQDVNEARVMTEVGNYDLLGIQGFTNFAISDSLYSRVSFDMRTRDGYRDNSPARVNSDDEDLKSGRFQLRYNPSEQLDMWVLAQYTKIGGQGPSAENIPFNYSGESAEPIHEIPDSISDGQSYPLYAPQIRDLEQWEIRGGVDYTLDNGITLSYLGGFNSIRFYRQQNINAYTQGSEPTSFVYRNIEKPETINQELRLSSDPFADFTWQVGLYYFKESSTVNAATEYNPATTLAEKGVEFDYPHIKSESKAVFAQVNYAISDQLKLTAGARYTKDTKERDGTFFIHPLLTGAPVPIAIPQPASTDSSEPTWTLGADYQLTDDSMIYAKVSSGYKVGGFNNAESDYGPETLISYELGSKNTFFRRSMQLNLAVYQMDYEDQQVTQFLSTGTGSSTVNAGKSTIRGLEFDLILQKEALGRLNLSGNYTDAEYDEFLASAGWDSTINLDLSGNSLPMSPEFTLSARYERVFELDGGATLTPSISTKYQSSYYFGANNFDSQKQDSYSLVDVGLDYGSADADWNVQFYIKNLADETVFADANEFYTFSNYTFSYQPPRTYGVRFTTYFM